MRVEHEGRIVKHENLSKQLDAALYGSMRKIQGIETISKILTEVIDDAQPQHEEVLVTYDLSSVLEVVGYVAKKAYSDISEIQEVLNGSEEKQALSKLESSCIMEEYTHRTLTAQEHNAENKGFFDKYFKE